MESEDEKKVIDKEKPTDEDRYKYLKDANDRVYEQLTYAEAKHGVLIGILGVAIFGIVGTIIDISCHNKLLWLQIILGVMSFSMLMPMLISLLSFYPNRKTVNNKSNMFFYGSLAQLKDGDEYIKKLANPEDIEKQLAEQNIIVSRIIMKKHNKFQIALKLTIASIILPFYIVLVIDLIKRLVKGVSKSNNKEK